MTKKRNTIGMFDLAKGMLMVLIVLGHSITEYLKFWEFEITVHWWYGLFFPLYPVQLLAVSAHSSILVCLL